MKFLTAVFAMTVIVLVTGPPSRALAASLQCGEAPAMLKQAKDHYDESPAYTGIIIGGPPVMITVSAKGSWTMFMVQDAGLCVIASGFAAVAPPAAAPETQSLPAPGLQANGLILIAK